MKHSKHTRSRSQSRNLNSYSNRDISSKSSKTKKALDIISKILFPIEMMLVIALIIYATLIEIFPLTYIFIFIVLLGILAGVHIRLLSGKKRRIKRKRIISICMSAVMFVVSGFGMSYFGIINNAIGDLTIDGAQQENEAQVDDISKHPFLVYLSGDDTLNASEINESGRSDVNMVVAINPQQKRVLMVSTPRDYYVPLYGDKNKMDKLTHAGSYGIECSMETLEKLYDIKFNYYAKLNFKSVVDIVDAVGGVTVNSEYNFSSGHSYTGKMYFFKKGENFLDGDKALAFARERKSFKNGDRQRGIHQQVLIKAVVEKAISPSMLIPSNIENMLKAISNNTKTNFSEKEIKKLISYQMSTMSEEWTFDSISVDGKNGNNYTYSYPNQLLYVMIPDTDTVEKAKLALDAVINGEEIVDGTESNVSSSK
ncbi:MAG: LCP family protein [Clostridia bacterium]|nr:LCP family protein [Clostridia bacterium]